MIEPVIEVLIVLLLVGIFVVFIIALAVGATLLVMALNVLRKISEVMRWPQPEKKKSRKR